MTSTSKNKHQISFIGFATFVQTVCTSISLVNLKLIAKPQVAKEMVTLPSRIPKLTICQHFSLITEAFTSLAFLPGPNLSHFTSALARH